MVYVDGSKNIAGKIELDGAKNAALPLIVAACLCSGDVILKNIPTQLNDVKVIVSILNEIGYKIKQEGTTLYFENIDKNNINYIIPQTGSMIRASLLLLPLLLITSGKVQNPYPGGCNLGDRKFDIILDSLTKMGANVNKESKFIKANIDNKFIGCDLEFHIATTIGTESAIISAVLGKGKTTIKNANTRPEVIDLINFLNKAGANIKYKTRFIEIVGVKELHGTEYQIIKDRHEGLSYMILAAMTRSEIMIKDFNIDNIKEDVNLLRNIGVDIYKWGGDLFVSAKNKDLKPFSMTTSPYPGINSDMQPILAALACTISGESILTDTRFTERFQYVNEFLKMGVDIVNYQNCAIVQGGKPINGTNVRAIDLRAGIALLFLGIVGEGRTTISNFYQIERGYGDIIYKLQNLNVKIHNFD